MATDLKYIRYVLFLMALCISADTLGQAKVRKLSTMINHPSLNTYAPYISADANALVFLSDNAEDNILTPFFSFRENADWKEPQVFPKYIHTRLNFLRGYGLSADGSILYFSTMKSPGVGGYDICTSDWKGAWANPVNLGAPINSKSHEACPSVTPDGKTMYFMRCEKMDQIKASNCKIFRVDKKSNGQWGDPVELPATINKGNSQAPRIMADAETLIFSSDNMGGKGGMDLYVSKFRNGSWSAPVAMSFANTEKDDMYVSVTALGRYLLRDSPGGRKNELVEYLIPDELRPRGMMKIDGKVADEQGKPLHAAYISLFDIERSERVFNGRPNSDGTFLLYAMEGSRYELSIDPEHGNKTYFSRTFDLTTDPIPQVEKVSAVLKPVMPDDELVLDGITFRENSGEIDMESSSRELKRFARVVTSNPALKFEIQVLFEGYLEDSIPSHPDLTEMMVDTILGKFVDIDSLGQLFERDTMSIQITYHNNRTMQQAQSVIDYLISNGANENNIEGFANAIPAIVPETRKTLVKARIIKM